MTPANQPEFDGNNSVVVPLAFFDKLMKCYYGNGPREGESQYEFVPESPAAEIPQALTERLRDTWVETTTPGGFEPKGAALRKNKVNQSGSRHDQATKKRTGPSEDN